MKAEFDEGFRFIIRKNADIITETDYAPAMFVRENGY